MAKKMAVKKNDKQRSLNFEMPRAGKAVIRSFIGLVALGVLIFIGMQGHSLYKTMWPVKKIAIQNEVQFIDKSELSTLISEQVEEGMWAIDLELLQQKLKNVNWVKNIEIRKVWPDQLILIVEEHQPAVRFGSEILTHSGTKVSIVKEQEWMKTLPVVEMNKANEKSAQDLKSVWSEYRLIKRQFELVQLNLDLLKIDEINNWNLYFESGLTVNLGRKHHKDRVERLVSVFDEIESKNLINQIDLRYSNGFAVELKEEVKDLNG